jgi:hypothetical protein
MWVSIIPLKMRSKYRACHPHFENPANFSEQSPAPLSQNRPLSWRGLMPSFKEQLIDPVAGVKRVHVHHGLLTL